MEPEKSSTSHALGLQAILASRPAAKTWFDASIDELGETFDDQRFHAIFSTAGRLLGRAPLGLTSAETTRLSSDGVAWPIDRWGTDELGRVLLLTSAFARLESERAVTLLEGCYAGADNRERQAVLRALPFLPAPERFVPLAADATRTNVLPVFEALACENPFPADWLPELNMNQLVMKAMFNGVALSRILGLGRRLGPELARMANDYAAERRAAGRVVPADIDLVLHPPTAH